jgi:single-stranded-DNA-specific exonuclease
MLCTAGLVYSVIAALNADPAWEEARWDDELETAGLATLADIAPLNPWGWAMAHHALLRLPQTVNLGLGELLKVSKLHGLSRITSRQVGFDLAPRLNAAGRMKHARWVPELLMANEPAKARELAMYIDRLNEERKTTGKLVAEQALRQALQFGDCAGLVLADAHWHPGVLGIVAARVVNQLGKPAMVLGQAPGAEGLSDDSDGSTTRQRLLSGSIRSIPGLDLMPCLQAVSHLLVSFGGHSAAAGVKVLEEQLDPLRDAWARTVEEHLRLDHNEQAERAPGAPAHDAALYELTAQFEDDVWRLAPSGPDFAAPRLALRGLKVARCSLMGAQKTHLNLVLTDGRAELRVAGFDMSHLASRLKIGDQVDVLVECEADNWNDRVGLALRLLELLT